MGLFSSVKKYKNQDYNALKKDAQQKGTLFIDQEFPPDDRSLFYTAGKLAGVVWKRPKQICNTPKLFVAGASSGDVHQGRLGNCWFVAASSCLAQYKQILHKIIPDHDGQEWDDNKPENYHGIFKFHFWRYGEWIEIVIDDFLPTLNDELVFVHSQSQNEFWSALLEKAYAKLFGCYEALDGGDLCEALEDFTGGVSDSLNLEAMLLMEKPEERTQMFSRMQKDMDRRSLMAASIPAESSEEMEASTDMGLVKGHAYGITAVKNIHLEGSGMFSYFNREKIPMVRLRNPWGQGEWKGAFSDGSKEWNKIDKNERDKMGLTFEEDGEFWMTFDDFCTYFKNCAICRTVNTSFISIQKTWSEGLAHSAWKKPERAGGCMNNKDTFLNNPQEDLVNLLGKGLTDSKDQSHQSQELQFSFDVYDDDEDVMIQLMQKTTRGQGGSKNQTIGFTVLKVEQNRRYRIHDLTLQEIIKSSVFRDSRSIFLRQAFKKGRYVVVPCIFEPGVEENFLLRVYTGSGSGFRPLLHDRPQKSWYSCCAKAPQLVTRIKVISAQGLERQDTVGGADPYCIISCEGEKVTTAVKKDTVNPEWNEAAIFYRKKPVGKPIKIQIWNNNLLRDSYLGKHVFLSSDQCQRSIKEVNLVGRKKEASQVRPGKLVVEITQSNKLTSI